MNKATLVEEVATRTGESKAATERFLAALQDVVVSTVASGDSVRLTGFADFSPTVRAARNMKNPRTGEEIHVPETKTVRIRPLKTFQDTVKNS